MESVSKCELFNHNKRTNTFYYSRFWKCEFTNPFSMYYKHDSSYGLRRSMHTIAQFRTPSSYECSIHRSYRIVYLQSSTQPDEKKSPSCLRHEAIADEAMITCRAAHVPMCPMECMRERINHQPSHQPASNEQINLTITRVQSVCVCV